MKRILRQLTTRPVWWWERKRQYAIRARYDLLPVLPVARGRVQFVVLTTPETLKDALWAAWSWYRYLRPHRFELQLAVDGELGETEKHAVRRLFPGISIYDVNSVIVSLCEERSALGTFLRHHPLAKQVGLVLAMSRKGPVLYSDHDVVAFNPPVELQACIESNIPCYFLDDENGCHDQSFAGTLSAMGVDFIRRLNAGFLYVPCGALSIDLAEHILANWNPVRFVYFTPQTVMSALMQYANAQPLPHSRYVISNRRQFYWEKDVDYEAIAARHFTGTVRHVLYKYGIPMILKQSQVYHSYGLQAQSDPREETVGSRDCATARRGEAV